MQRPSFRSLALGTLAAVLSTFAISSTVAGQVRDTVRSDYVTGHLRNGPARPLVASAIEDVSKLLSTHDSIPSGVHK